MLAKIAESAPPVSILMYHQVGEFPAPKTHRAGFCHIRRFRAQMAYLKLGGYRVISLGQALAGLFNGAPLAKRSVVLTFDDGYQNFYDYAFPVLRRYQFPATVFLVAGLVGKKAQWLEDDGRYGPPLLGIGAIRELTQKGISIGAHSMGHPRLSTLSEPRQRDEIFASKARLQDMLGEPVADFCYPYGDYDDRSRALVAEAGYRSGLTCIRGAANTADGPLEIPRKAISYGDNVIGFFWKLHMKHARKDRRRR